MGNVPRLLHEMDLIASEHFPASPFKQVVRFLDNERARKCRCRSGGDDQIIAVDFNIQGDRLPGDISHSQVMVVIKNGYTDAEGDASLMVGEKVKIMVMSFNDFKPAMQ